MSVLSKIKVGFRKGRNHLDLSHPVETTLGFGFCQPTFVRCLPEDSNLKVNTKTFVRLAGMPCPTFGLIKVKSYNAFVPFEEVFEGYNNFMEQTSINAGINNGVGAVSYIPQSSDFISSKNMLGLIGLCSLKEYAKLGNSFEQLARPLLNMTILIPETTSTGAQYVPLGRQQYTIAGGEESVVSAVNSLVGTEGLIDDYDGIAGDLICSLVNDSTFVAKYEHTEFSDVLNTTIGGTNELKARWLNSQYAGNLNAYKSQDDDVNIPSYKAYYRNFSNMDVCDFVAKSVGCGDNSVTINLPNSQTLTFPVYYGYNLTRSGQRLFSILNLCGFKGFKYAYNMDLLRLFAYYKAYFDIMNPARTKQWFDTNCYRLIHNYYDTGTTLNSILNNSAMGVTMYDDDADYYNVRYWRSTFESFLAFLREDLPNCFYTEPVNHITCSTPEPVLDLDSNKLGSLDLYDERYASGSKVMRSHADDDPNTSQYTNVYPAVFSDNGLNGLLLKGMLRAYAMVNKNSVIGLKINDYLKTHFGYNIEESHRLGDSEFVVNIDDPTSTVNNDQTFLGEYAGKGVGAGEDSITCENSKPGVFVQFTCIIPYGEYVQANDFALIDRYDFFHKEYDSLGKEPITRSQFVNTDSYDLFKNNTVFGFRPRYFNYKVANGVHNGDFARRSARQQFLPYSLDKIFNETRFGGAGAGMSPEVLAPDTLACDEELRYIGKYEQFGNYDRIFYDTTGGVDNFILHIYQNADLWAPMLPTDRSFETFDEETDNDTRKVELS